MPLCRSRFNDEGVQTYIVDVIVTSDEQVHPMSIFRHVLDCPKVFGQFDVLELAEPCRTLTLGTRQCVKAMIISTPCSSLSSFEISIAVSTIDR